MTLHVVGRRALQVGFSLVELMVVMVIMGILAAIAMPQYNEHLLKGKLTEATSLLSDLQLRQEQYYQDNRTYLNGMTPRAAGSYFTSTSCATANSGQTYICTATAPTLNYTFRVTEAGAKTTTTPTGTTASCWLRGSATSC